MPHGTEVHALDSSWPPTHACPAAVTQYPCASVASKSCMTWHDLIAVMTSALWLLALHPAINFRSMRIEMSAVVSISGPPLDLQYSTVAVPGQLSEKEKKAVAKMDKKMGTVEKEPDEPSDSQPHDDDDDDEPNAGSSKPAKSQAKGKAKAKAKAKAQAKAKQVAKAKKASTMKKPAKALQKKPSQK